MSDKLIVYALNQLADRFDADGDDAFQRSRRIRDAHTNAETERFEGSDDEHYELGYAEARSSSCKSAATKIREAIKAIEEDARGRR